MKKTKFHYTIGEMTKRLLHYAAPIKGYLTVSALASIVGNLSHMGVMGFGCLWILRSAGYTTLGSPWLFGGLTILSGILIAVCRYLEGVFSHLGAYGILAGLRVHLYNSISRVAPGYLIGRETGDIMNIAVADIETLEFFYAHMIGPMFTLILLPVITVVIAAQFSYLYALILIPIYVLNSVILPLIALKAGRGIGMGYRERLGELKALILESVYGIRDIQIFRAGEKRRAKVQKANDRVNQATFRLTLHRQTVASAPNFFVYLARIMIIAAAGFLASIGEGNPLGTIVVSFIAVSSLSSTFNLTTVVTNLLETYAAAERIFIIEDAEPETVDPETSEPLDSIETIEFQNVTFTYPGTDLKILENFNLKIEEGERLGMIGASGAGKSTILRLLLRFYKPDSGEILINGIPIDRFSFAQLHRHIALLEQDTYLFATTIEENIRIAKPDATHEEIVHACEQAGIAELIATLPLGYDTDMGQMGARLSGGERQRIGISRILLKSPDVCLMDEPSSALDTYHEKELLYTLDSEFAGRTLLLISHRMSTIGHCTRVVEIGKA